jgi:diacylglycerol kinase family enzyme
MDVLLYNPYSERGKTIETAKLLQIQLGEGTIIESLADASLDYKAFLYKYRMAARFIIIGGDGTIHRLANAILSDKLTFSNNIYIYAKSGTCNDFVRSLNTKEKFINISEYLKRLPTVTTNDTHTEYYLNGAGLGFDGYVCHCVEASPLPKSKGNFAKCAIKAMGMFQRGKKVKVNIDGVEKIHKNVWLATVMNAPFTGGGMNFAPKADRNKQSLYLVIVKRIPSWLMWIVFPLVYLGLQKILLGVFSCKEVTDYCEVDFGVDTTFQADGEVQFPTNKMLVKVAFERNAIPKIKRTIKKNKVSEPKGI